MQWGPMRWDPNMSSRDAIRLYERMLLLRIFEERVGLLYQQGNIHGFLHLYIGQEALGVGALDALLEKDYVVSTYRDHGHILARGTDPGRIMAELYGKETGVSRGFGGSMHMVDPARNFVGGYGIVGAHIPIAAGIGYAIRYRGEDQCVLCFLGDGSVNIGPFHEGMNAAQLYRLPIVFIVENNHYAIATGEGKSHSVERVVDRADGYGMRKAEVDGMDVVASRQAVEEALEYARDGKGPTFLVAETYRFRGHSSTDPGLYRSKQEETIWKSRDPIDRFERLLREELDFEESFFETMREKVTVVVDDAEQFAEESAFPDDDARFQYLFFDPQNLVDTP